MPKLILLVDSDAALRSQVAKALAARGFELQENPDGREVIEQVRASQPDAVVLCVELPKSSGYAVCSKLRKDDALKKIPVILTSAEATQKAFDDHKKLKNGRADEYLLKPFTPDDLLEKIEALIGAGEPEAAAHEDSLGLSDLAAEFGDAPLEEGISLEEVEEISVEDDLAPTSASLPGEQDVEMLESAFEKLEERDETSVHQAINGHDHDALHEEVLEEGSTDERDSTDVLAALGSSAAHHHPVAPHVEPSVAHVEPSVAHVEPSAPSRPPVPPPPESLRASPSMVGGSRDKDYFQLKEKLAQREKDLLRLREELTEKEKELVEQREHETQVEQEVSTRDEELGKRDAQLKQLQQKVDALVAGQKRLEKDLSASREEARAASSRAESAEQAKTTSDSEAGELRSKVEGLETDLSSARERVSELEAETERQRSQSDETGAELTGVRAQLDEANTAMDELRNRLEVTSQEAESTQEDLRRRISDLEDEKQKHEDRVVKAFQRLKSEEQLREKAKKALGIALQLLDEPGEESEASAESSDEGQLS